MKFETNLFSNAQIEELLGYLQKLYRERALDHLTDTDNPHKTTITQAATAETTP